MMKKILLLLLLSLLIPIASAQIQIEKTTFNSLETIQLEILFDNLQQPITLTNIKITDLQNQKQNIPINLLKITDNHYFVFFQIGTQGNYNIKIENIKYLEHGILKQITLTKNIEITDEKSPISISPAAFVYEKGIPTFTVSIKNNLQLAKTVFLKSNHTSLEFNPAITIPGNTIKQIKIKLRPELETSSKATFEINNYTVPIYITPTTEIKNIEIFLNNQEISSLTKEIKEKTTSQGTLEIKNNFNQTKTFDIKLTGNLNQILRTSKNKLTIEPDKKQELELYINEDKNPQEESCNGNIEFTTQEYKKSLPIEFTIIPEEIIQEEETPEEQEQYEELEPEEPLETEQEITEEPAKPKTGLVLTIILIALLVLIIFFVIRKPIQTKPMKPKWLRDPKNQ